MKKVISKDELTTISLWDLPLVSEGNEPVEIPNPRVSVPTVNDIEDIQRKAHDEAHKEGLAQGIAEGQAKGYEEGLQQGKKEGFAQGAEQGLVETREDIEQKINSFISIIELLDAPLTTMDDEVERQLVTLAMSVAKHLVRRELKTDSSQVVAAIRQAVEVLPVSARNIRVFLHPEDAKLVIATLSVDAGSEEEKRWKIVEDAALTRGGCNIQSDQTRVDSTVETRLTAIIAQVLGGVREGDLQDSQVPETKVPETKVPETKVQEAEVQEAEVQEAKVPETKVPEIEAQKTEIPGIDMPEDSNGS